jgi:hypothetical protein
MARKTRNVPARSDASPSSPQTTDAPRAKQDPSVHVYGRHAVCATEGPGYRTPGNLSPAKLVVNVSEGFVPLWEKGATLRWRFQARSLENLPNPAGKREAIKSLLGEAILAWGDAAPVTFTEQEDTWDFEVVTKKSDDCTPNGCVLASAFFPDAGRHQLVIYPKLFQQSHQEQVETLIHEIGHIFGLRHFFAKIQETQWASEIFGTHNPFTIMNYGAQSVLTETDKADLKRLYQLAWRREIEDINGTPIRLVRPYHALAESASGPRAIPFQTTAWLSTAPGVYLVR